MDCEKKQRSQMKMTSGDWIWILNQPKARLVLEVYQEENPKKKTQMMIQMDFQIIWKQKEELKALSLLKLSLLNNQIKERKLQMQDSLGELQQSQMIQMINLMRQLRKEVLMIKVLLKKEKICLVLDLEVDNNRNNKCEVIEPKLQHQHQDKSQMRKLQMLLSIRLIALITLNKTI